MSIFLKLAGRYGKYKKKSGNMQIWPYKIQRIKGNSILKIAIKYL